MSPNRSSVEAVVQSYFDGLYEGGDEARRRLADRVEIVSVRSEGVRDGRQRLVLDKASKEFRSARSVV